MRHNRRAVMTERYKLYMKKHIFNGRYFVRNMQIFICTVVVTALVIGCLVLGHSGSDDVVTADTSVSVKDALFGNSEEVNQVTKTPAAEENTEAVDVADEEVTTEEASTEMIVAEAVVTTEEIVEEPKEESEFANKCIADVEETLNVRKGPSTDTEFVGSMNPGAIATVLGTEGEWTKIKSGDVEGYVLSEFVRTGESAEKLAEDYVTLRGTVLEDGVNIRSEKSTDADILVVLDKDDTLTVLEQPVDEGVVVNATAEEAAEVEITEAVAQAAQKEEKEEPKAEKAITWVPVMLEDGQTGYVSADLLDVDELYEIAVSAEELERQAAEEAARKAAEEEAARQAAEEAARQASGSSSNSGSSNNDTAYKGATTTPVTATESGDCIGTFTITAYCGCKKCSGGSNKTASGTTPTEGRTIAADTSILPFGTQVVIDGVVYTVEDCGSGVKGNHIDIFFATHKKALAFGRKTLKVYKY